MEAVYVCEKIKKLCADYKDAINCGQAKEAESDLNSLKGLIAEFQQEKKQNFDSAFFAGELDCRTGDKDAQYPDAVEAYRKRRRERKDCKAVEKFKERRQKRLDDKGPDDWITVNGNHIPIDNEGNPIGGQMKAFGDSLDGAKTHRHDGTVIGNHVKDWSNKHVSSEEREQVRKDANRAVGYGRQIHGYYNPKAFYSTGSYVRDEIKRRSKLRKNDEDYKGEPQIEDIYDVLRDVRDFGPPEDFDKIKFGRCEIDHDRAKELLQEAMDRYPTDWYNGISNGDVEVNVIDSYGRACFDRYSRPKRMFIYAKERPEVVKELGVDENFCDNEIVRQMVHELGHYFEDTNAEVQSAAMECLEQRTKKSPEVPLNDGYMSKPDSFFRTYTGKQYYDGSTEITSTMVETLQYADPFKYFGDMNWDTGKKDRDSLKYILGILVGL